MSDPVWFSAYDANVPRQLSYPEEPLYRLLEKISQRYPQHVALDFMGYQVKYGQLWQQVQHIARSLQDLGIKPGDRVAIMLPNTPQQVMAFYGITLAGAVVVNVSPLYVARELALQLQDSGAETLIILDQFYPRYAEIAESVGVKQVFVTGIQHALPFPKNILYPLREKLQHHWTEIPKEVMHFERLLQNDQLPLPHHRSLDDVTLLQYTGGTTGTPKGTMLSQRNLVANTYQALAWLPDLKEGSEIVLAAIPFFHVYGMTVGMNLALLLGAKIVLIPNPRDIKTLLHAIDQHKPSIFPGVPTLYAAINQHPDTPKHNLHSIRVCISGSAPLPAEVANQFIKITQGAHLVEGYGLTEASPITHVNPIYGQQIVGSIGLPIPGVLAQIMDTQGQPMAITEVGELWVQGDNIMLGYWNNPSETAKVLPIYNHKHWLATGDMARMDAQGYFYIVDRQKDVILVSGFNVYPREVEEVLYQHPAVLEVAVFGVSDHYRGEHPKAAIVLKTGQHATAQELEHFCRERLSPYKIPREYDFYAELPKSAVGKILRRALKNNAISPSKTDIS